MKSYIITLLFSSLLLITYTHSSAQEKQDTTVSFKVSGVCGLCRDRIKKAAKGKGVSNADWSAKSQMLTLTFDPTLTTIEKVADRIAEAGHDNYLKKADDAVYKTLHSCCRYRGLEEDEPTEVPSKDTNAEKAEVKSNSIVSSPQHTNSYGAHKVNGLVVEDDRKGSFKPLIGASIIWLGTNTGTTTDSSGFFAIALDQNSTKLVVSYTGYKPDTIIITSPQRMRIVLASNKQLNEVRVTSTKMSTYINAYDPFRKAVMTQKELLKAACCNLSESFETNPSVDVSFNDAVTGSKQIQLLGLSGNYSQLTVENLPGPRGLATPMGLNSIPGTWVESIQLIKGTGSVINGFESISGQINVELKKPATMEQLYANVYTNDFGKTDLNLNLAKKIGKQWSTALLLHDAFGNKKMDFNKDGFRDLPTGNLFSGINRWNYDNEKGFMMQFGVKVLNDEKTGGEVDFNPAKDKLTMNNYGLQYNIDRKEAFAKIGYVFPQKKFQSIGLQLSAFDHQQDSYFGLTTYNGRQKNFYSNLIYQSIIGNSDHKFKTGLSFVMDDYNEDFNTQNFRRKEVVPGAFFEYTYSPSEKLDIVAGVRGDHNSLYGAFVTPRLNVRYEPVSGTTIRASAGRGQRTANIFAENNSVLVSSRNIVLPASSAKAYGLDPEVAWNKGISIDQKLHLFNRNANLSFDFFRNDFQNQVVVDLENPREVKFYNLEGKSFSNSFQTEVSAEPFKALTAKLAYRFFDVKSTFGNQLLQKPLTAQHRAFANLGYEVKGWKFDYTVSYNSKKRIPSTQQNPIAYQRDSYSPDYTVMNAQISKTVGKKFPVDLYVGGENLTNFFQKDAIIAADQPFSPYFDASLVWGPVSGRMFYGGVRFKIK
ncbi:TonB-dependent receptor [Chitinophagaceae bacterium LB-8]|uniref:TonB-dependent receptor n=1 Tax=Paraflavisolibacter caeni TaxID=2982496 RepID=A0A9X2XT93_9BACT|nr:TonB-dependent receptor [Paraflavisolibacter caeni]MCU7548764.1 TonB-dependent receptor [Paraflavisolibacter caeni]